MRKETKAPKYGARVYLMGKTLLVKQTILRGIPAEYVVDGHKEEHVPANDDAAVAAAVRAAISGRLK